tara:strand:+ start:3822 stop:6098 length:2277 start_codon:yes stop_codon:yes gene_type:complete
MAEQSIPLTIPSGINKNQTAEGAKGRWIDAKNIVFKDGKPRKRAGNEVYSSTLFEGRARGMAAWNTVKGRPLYGLGTHLKVYGSTDGIEPTDITPFRFSNNVVDKFTTTDGSGILSLELTAHGLSVDDAIRFYGNSWNGGSKVGGITLSQEYEVLVVTDVDNVTLIRNNEKATLTDPFTTDGTTLCTVVDVAHGQVTGAQVFYADATAVGGQTPDDEYPITVVDDDSYTIVLSGTATAATGGGTVARNFIDLATSTETGGGTVDYVLYLTDPLTTTSGQTSVKVTQAGHGALYNDGVYITGATALGGVTVDGFYRVTEVIDVDNFTFDHTASATSTATGGGTVLVEYEISPGPADRVIENRGFGSGSFGFGAFGSTALVLDPVYYDARSVSFDNIGEDAVFCPLGGSVYYWDSSETKRAEVIPSAPTQLRYAFQTEERHLHVLGVNGDPLVFGWATQDQVNDWTATDTNTANESRRVTEGSELIAGCSVSGGMNLLWTDTACYQHQYTGSSFIYDTRIAAKNAGIVGPMAWCNTPKGTIWMSQTQFHIWNGSVMPVPRAEDLESWVFDQVDTVQLAKSWLIYNPKTNSVHAYFVPVQSGEPSKYVIINLDDWSWVNGEELRTTGAFFDSGDQNPIQANIDGLLYRHEVGVNDSGAAADSYIEYATIDIARGGVSHEILGIDPDFLAQTGDVEFQITTYDRNKNNSVDTETAILSTDEELSDLRVHGRKHNGKFAQNLVDGDFSIDTPTILIQVSGTKR